MARSFLLLAFFSYRAASRLVMIVRALFWLMRATLVRAAGQRKVGLPDTRTVHPLQRQANTNYQEVER